MLKLCKNWYNLLSSEFQKPYFITLQQKLNDEYAKYTIYPPIEKVFTALNFVKYQDVKVVIIGQDPYHEPNQAMGMSFSVPDGVQIPPSLVNIFKEINSDIDIKCYNSGKLSQRSWLGKLDQKDYWTFKWQRWPCCVFALGWQCKSIFATNQSKQTLCVVGTTPKSTFGI